MNTVSDTRFNKIAFGFLLTELDEVSQAQLPDALKVIEDGIVSRGICSAIEASALTKRILALRFAQQYPPEVLARIQEVRAQN